MKEVRMIRTKGEVTRLLIFKTGDNTPRVISSFTDVSCDVRQRLAYSNLARRVSFICTSQVVATREGFPK